ncbi:uncharacterized protein LOC144747582 [Ciona intestinalis]
MTCDILAGEQGPSCCLLDQLPNFNVVHIRAIANTTELACKENSKFKLVVSSSLPQIKRRKTDHLQPQQISVEFSVKREHPIPKSLSVVEMMKLGNVMDATSTKIKLSQFHISDMMWSTEIEEIIRVEKESFSQGGFRKAYKVQSSSKLLPGTWVLKQYLPETLDTLNEINQTPEGHTRKIVQMHMLAANFTSQLAKAVQNLTKGKFGYIPTYTKIYFGKITDGEEDTFVTLEEYIHGKFTKYTSNDGTVCGNKETTACKKQYV